MKHLSILLIFLFIGGAAWGQCGKWNEPITIILHSGDTIQGWVRSWIFNPHSTLTGSKKYKSKDCIKKVVDNTKIKEFIVEEGHFFFKEVGGDVLQLKLEEAGVVSCYSLTMNVSSYDSNTMMRWSREYTRYYIEKDGKVQRIPGVRFRKKLLKIFADCPDIHPIIKKCRYDGISLSRIVMKYNQWLELRKSD